MIPIKERYVVDEKGNRIAVLLDLEDYRRLLGELEELESIRAYDAAKASGGEAVPFEQAVAEIERERQIAQKAVGLEIAKMPNLDVLVQQLRTDIAARCGRDVEARRLKAGRYAIRAKKAVAYAHKMPRKGFVKIFTKKEWADKAGVTYLAQWQVDNGWWGQPAIGWDVEEANSGIYRNAVDGLGRICLTADC